MDKIKNISSEMFLNVRIHHAHMSGPSNSTRLSTQDWDDFNVLEGMVQGNGSQLTILDVHDAEKKDKIDSVGSSVNHQRTISSSIQVRSMVVVEAVVTAITAQKMILSIILNNQDSERTVYITDIGMEMANAMVNSVNPSVSPGFADE